MNCQLTIRFRLAAASEVVDLLTMAFCVAAIGLISNSAAGAGMDEVTATNKSAPASEILSQLRGAIMTKPFNQTYGDDSSTERENIT
jgi:hypothetical protein